MQPLSNDLFMGLVWASIAILLWSGSLVMLRLGVTTSLTAPDLTALRFGVAAILLAPVILGAGIFRPGLAWVRPGPLAVSIMVFGFGAPYILLVSVGLRFAPAGAAGALNPGLMAVFVVLGGWRIFNDKPSLARLAGIAAILAGVVLFADVSTIGRASIGHLIFAISGVMWATYALTVRHSGISALQATAIVATRSAAIYLPVYLVALPKHLLDAPLADILLQAGFQGVLVSIVALIACRGSCCAVVAGSEQTPPVRLHLDFQTSH